MLELQNRHIWQIHNFDVTVKVSLQKMGGYYQKNILCANQNVDSFVAKEIISDNHSSQTRHTRTSCVNVMFVLSLLVCCILQALSPVLAEHAEGKVNAADNGFKPTLCPKWKKKIKQHTK